MRETLKTREPWICWGWCCSRLNGNTRGSRRCCCCPRPFPSACSSTAPIYAPRILLHPSTRHFICPHCISSCTRIAMASRARTCSGRAEGLGTRVEGSGCRLAQHAVTHAPARDAPQRAQRPPTGTLAKLSLSDVPPATKSPLPRAGRAAKPIPRPMLKLTRKQDKHAHAMMPRRTFLSAKGLGRDGERETFRS